MARVGERGAAVSDLALTLLDTPYYGNTVTAWLIALAAALSIFVALQLVKRLVVRRLARTAAGTAIDLDDIALQLLRKTRGAFFTIVAIYFASFLLYLTPRITHAIDLTMIVALLAQIAIVGNSAICLAVTRYNLKRVSTHNESTATITALGYFSRLLLWAIALLLVLDNLGINITALIAGLGITGIAVALAVQNILGDLFASFSIMLDRPFVIGDFIVVDNFMGHVEYIGLKTTRLRSVFGEQIIFSNADLLKSRIRNHKRMLERRVVFNLSLTYENTHDLLRRVPTLVREAVSAQAHARFGRAHFREYRDFALIFEIVYFIDTADYELYMDIQQDINLAIFQRFHEHGVEFAHHATAHTQHLPAKPAAKEMKR